MSIAAQTPGAVATGTTGITVAYPASIAAGDLLVLFLANKYPNNAPSTPAGGWVAVTNGRGNGGSGAAGADTGTVYCSVFVKVASGSEAGNLSVTVTSGNSCIGRMFRYTKASGTTWDYAATNGADNTAGTPWSVTGAANPGITTGDLVIVGSGINTDTYTYASEAISATGATFGTMAEPQDSTTNLGDDSALVVTEHPVTAGTASAAPVYTMTASGTTTNRPAGASVILRIREIDPPLTQAAFRFYEDGTESGSTAIDSQNTNITRNVDSNSNLSLRVRVQNGAAAPGLSTDDYQLQYELNDSGTYTGIGPTVTIDSYSESNQSALVNLDNEVVNFSGVSQTITGDGTSVGTSIFYLKKTGSPTGNAVSKIYATSGSNGTNAIPTGAALATSGTFDVSTLTGSYALTTFTFTGANQVTLTNGVVYAVTIEYSSGSSGNSVDVGTDSSSPTHAGNYGRGIGPGSWIGGSTNDACFYVINNGGAEVIGFNSASLTDGSATTNRLGAGTGSFVAGEISEDGLVDDHLITASNYTEHLYSLTLIAAELADNDTLDFRVLRNGATTGVTYTVTPRITVDKSAGGSPNTTDFFLLF